ncbi:MAG TPA: 30S ribosomal protein S16 [Chloroflexota bacterium]|nr:30S ribosomal protein S16 [Chloroflexota bacterium]
MLKIRLNRTGARKKPSYRIVVAESTAPRDGKYIEIIGTYDPLTDPATVVLKEERAKHWLSVGAQPTERVVRLMAREGLMEAPTYAAPAPKESDGGSTAAASAPAAAPAAVAEAEPAVAEAEPAAGDAESADTEKPDAE